MPVTQTQVQGGVSLDDQSTNTVHNVLGRPAAKRPFRSAHGWCGHSRAGRKWARLLFGCSRPGGAISYSLEGGLASFAKKGRSPNSLPIVVGSTLYVRATSACVSPAVRR